MLARARSESLSRLELLKVMAWVSWQKRRWLEQVVKQRQACVDSRELGRSCMVLQQLSCLIVRKHVVWLYVEIVAAVVVLTQAWKRYVRDSAHTEWVLEVGS